MHHLALFMAIAKKKIKKETQYIDPISPYAISKITNEYFCKNLF